MYCQVGCIAKWVARPNFHELPFAAQPDLFINRKSQAWQEVPQAVTVLPLQVGWLGDDTGNAIHDGYRCGRERAAGPAT